MPVQGITPTLIFVRVSMGLSFRDENSLVEISRGSLHFAPSDPNPVTQAGHPDIVDQERNNNIETQLGDHSDIVMVER